MQNYTQILFFAAIIAVFYFLIIRPQKKRQNDQLDLMSKLKPGAEILTIGGIYGTIVSVDDDRVRISVADGSELIMAKRAIAQLVAASDAKGQDDDDDTATAEPDEFDESVDADESADADAAGAADDDEAAPTDSGDDARSFTNPDSANV